MSPKLVEGTVLGLQDFEKCALGDPVVGDSGGVRCEQSGVWWRMEEGVSRWWDHHRAWALCLAPPPGRVEAGEPF